jgi:hypothetical protein
MTGTRFLYYNAWKLGEAACIGSGLGYSGTDKNRNNEWETVVSINVKEVELGTSCTPMVKYWNHTVHLWLNRYVFERVVAKGGRPTMVNNLTVYAVSAFWHGFYPAYYIMFFQLTFLAELTKDIFRSRVFFQSIPYPVSATMSHVLTYIFLNYLGISFGLLGLEPLKNLAESTCYIFYIVVFPAFIFFRFSGITVAAGKKMKKIQEAKAKKD